MGLRDVTATEVYDAERIRSITQEASTLRDFGTVRCAKIKSILEQLTAQGVKLLDPIKDATGGALVFKTGDKESPSIAVSYKRTGAYSISASGPGMDWIVKLG